MDFKALLNTSECDRKGYTSAAVPRRAYSEVCEPCARQKQISDAAPDDHRHDYTELNEAFRNLLAEIRNKDDGR